jgi:hypothetical protein
VQARRRLLRLRRASECLGTSRGSSRGSSSTTSPPPRVRVPRHVARLVVDHFASRRLVVDYFDYATRPGASARRAARRAARDAARRRLLRLRRASRCLDTSRGSSRSSSSTTSPTSRVRLLRHVARHVARLVAPLVNYFASRRLVVDYFTYAALTVASARRAACRVTHGRLLRLAQARHRLLRLRRAPGCLGTSRDSSRGLSSTTSPPARVRVPWNVARLIVDYFARPVASVRRAACRAARRQLLRLAQACRQLLHLRRVSGCLGTSRGSSRCSPSTTLPTSRVRVPQHVTRLVVDYSVRHDFVLRPHWLYFSHAVCRDYLSCGNTGSTSTTPRAAATSSFGHIASTIHLD